MTGAATGAMDSGDSGTDFDLHGIVGIRLIDARPADVARVVSQLGPIQRPLDRAPDIVIRFVDSLKTAPLTYVGLRDGGFTPSAFYVLRGKGAVDARALVPFQDIGHGCEIVCEREMPSVPLLLPLINLTALSKDVLPLHASAFVHDGRGVLATGWAKGGKTELLLSFLGHGATYVGDEWVYLPADGRMLGIPEPIRLWSWQLEQLLEVAARLTRRERARLAVLHKAALATKAADRTPSSVLRRLAPVVQRQAYVQVPPRRAFGAEAVALSGRLDAVVLVLSHEGDDIGVDAAETGEVVGRMAASLAEEREPFLRYYRQWRYAFPECRSDVVEHAEALERRLLEQRLGGRPAFRLQHPYPVRISDLYSPLATALSQVAS